MSPHADPRRRPRQPHPGSGPGSSHPPQASPGSPPRPGLPRSLARRVYRRRYRPAPRTSHDQNFKDLILDYPQAALAFFAAEEGIHCTTKSTSPSSGRSRPGAGCATAP